MRLPPVCPFHPINKELCSSTGWRSGDVRDTHTRTRRRYGFRGVEPTVAGNEYLQVASNKWATKPAGAEGPLSTISVEPFGVACECKTSCSHSEDAVQLGFAPSSDAEPAMPLRVQRQQCAVLAAKLMVASMSASAQDLVGFRTTLQQMLRKLESAPPSRPDLRPWCQMSG
jgi:hypothetical protein